MKNSVSERIRKTKTGKIVRRSMGLGHFRAKKRSTQIKRRKAQRTIDVARFKNLEARI